MSQAVSFSKALLKRYISYLNVTLHVIRRKKQILTWSLVLLILIMLISLRFFCGSLDTDALRYYLLPAVVFTEIVTGYVFHYLPGKGYVSDDLMFCIDKSCSGLNYLIILLSLALFLCARYKEGFRFLRFFGIAALISCAAAQLANGIRIVLSIKVIVFQNSFNFMQGVEHWMHTAVGAFVFLLCLLCCYFGADFYFKKGEYNGN